jgi:hypothetical protein
MDASPSAHDHWRGTSGADSAKELIAREKAVMSKASGPELPDRLFPPGGPLAPLVVEHGSREEALAAIFRSPSSGLPGSGEFEVVRAFCGRQVVLSGRVVDGVPDLDTAELVT